MKRWAIIVLSLAVLSSCSVQRALTVDKSARLDSESITAAYHPEGKLESVTYKCSVPGPSFRKMLVYLPKGYDGSGLSYPTLYLIHGARGNETSWFKDGDLIPIVDSLVAEGKAVPSIIVLPNMNQYDDDADFDDSRFKRAIESFFETDGTVEAGFMDDVVPVIDSLYRTIPDKDHRAIAGLSVGALQSIFISAWNPDSFGSVGMFSPLYQAPPRHGSHKWFYKGLKNLQVKQFRNPPKIYMIEIGEADFFHPHISFYRNYLNAKGYPYQYIEYPGGHNWKNWKIFFTHFYENLFK